MCVKIPGFPSTTEGVKYFMSKYGADMINGIKGTGVHFALAVAENCWESGYGTSCKVQKYNNFAGIKAMSQKRRDYIQQLTGIMPGITDGWTSFDSPLHAFKSYAVVVSTKAGFSDAKTAQEQLKIVANSGYCTSESPDSYMNNVNRIMKQVLLMYNYGILI